MCLFNRSLLIRLLMLGLLVVLAAGAVSGAPGQVMIKYSSLPIYGRDSSVNATMDLYLPNIALDETQHALGITLANDLPAVLFVPALAPEIMQEYAQNLTARGYGVIAVDSRPVYAVADSMCALAWAHQVGPSFHLDPTHIAAVGAGSGGQIAALMGSADLGWRPTYEGGLVRVDTPAPYPIHGLERCPYAMPEAPMIEAVATYNAELGTPVALVDTDYQMAMLPPVGTTRAQMVAAFDEFAFAPPDEWQGMVVGSAPEPVVSAEAAAGDQVVNLNLWQIAPPEVAAAHEVTTSVDVELPLMEGNAEIDLWQIAPPEVAASHAIEAPADAIDLWQLTPPEVAAMFQEPGTVERPLVAVNEVAPASLDLWQLTPPEVAAMYQGEPTIAELNPDWMADVAIVLPAYWLDGNEPPHLLLVSDKSDAMLHADNAVYTELLRDEGVPVQLTELAGCDTEACAPPAVLDSLDLFLDEVLYSS